MTASITPPITTVGTASSPSRIEIAPKDDGCALQLQPEAPTAQTYGAYQSLLSGRGTMCLPMADPADVPPPPEEIRALWNQVVQQSNQQAQKQVQAQVEAQQTQCDRQKAKKLERLLMMALHSGNMELAMLLFSSMETKQANDLSTGLMNQMRTLQSQKSQYIDQLAGLDSKSADAAKQTNVLNTKIGDLSSQMQILQTFLQDATSHKNEAQEMVSSYLKADHDLAMSIARNVA